MLSVLLLCAVFTACVWLVLRMRTGTAHAYEEPPDCPGTLPIIGVTHLVLTDTTKLWENMKLLSELTLQNGGVVKTKIGIHKYYVIADPEDALTVVNACLQKHYVYRFGECLIGQSLVTASVPIWKRHRKLLSPAFSLHNIHGFVDIFNDQAKKMVVVLEAMAGRGPFKVSSYVENTVLRTSCLTTLGTCNLQNEEFFQKYSIGFRQALHILTQRFQKFWQHNDLIYKLSGQKKIQDDIVEPLCEMIDEIIQKASDAMQNDRSKVVSDDQQLGVRSFLDSFLRVGANKLMTNKEVREELYGTIAASFETTAHQLESILILLGSHPKIQDRVFQEIIQVIGEDRDITKADLHKLVYTDAVIKESVRICTPAPVIARFIDRDVKLKHYTLRAGAQGLIMIYGIHRHSSWGPDAEQFRPERWLEPGGVPNIASAFAGFSLGKRTCIGKTYAITSTKITLAHLLRTYILKADYTKLKHKWDITLKLVEGHEISLEKRSY